jgi:hypothetical protein
VRRAPRNWNCKAASTSPTSKEGETVKDLQKLKESLILTARDAAINIGIGEPRARAFFDQSWAVIEEQSAADTVEMRELVLSANAVLAARGVGYDCPVCSCGEVHSLDCPLERLKTALTPFDSIKSEE